MWRRRRSSATKPWHRWRAPRPRYVFERLFEREMLAMDDDDDERDDESTTAAASSSADGIARTDGKLARGRDVGEWVVRWAEG